MHDGSAVLLEVGRLYRQGLYLQAYRAAKPLGPLSGWRGAGRRVLAGRLAAALGTYRLCYALHLRAHREEPSDPLAAYYRCRAIMHRRGPWVAWKAAQAIDPRLLNDPELAGDWLMLRGLIAAQWRDFDRADAYAGEALKRAPDRAWLHVEHSYILQFEDRIDEAKAAASRGLELHPWFRPGLQALAQIHQVAGDLEGAVALLQDATEHVECGDLILQLADLEVEQENFDAALASIDRAEAMLPLLDKSRKLELAVRRSEAAYRSGDEAKAVAAAEQVGPGFFESVAQRLKAASPSDRRVVLPVPFVRQHHLTCAPATLTSICRYWQKPADHLQIAEEICFDGTPAHSERRWAEQSGFYAREFTVDWQTAVELIDRGVPFTFTTVEVTSAHLQAVVGYDARRGTLLIRDPSIPRLTEMLGELGLEHYRGYGPRGMVLVPPEERGRIEGLELRDATLYDQFYEAQQALDVHHRAEAHASLERMRASDPEHQLTLAARRMMAAYDSDDVTSLRVSEEWSAQFPDSAPLLFARLNMMRGVSPRSERLEFLEKLCNDPTRDPVFRLNLAEELLDDARSHERAGKYLKSVLRVRPMESRAFFALANMAWAGRNFDEALDLYRLAACLEERREYCTQRYFLAAREMGQVETALAWLESRVRRFGKKSGEPAQTLFWALNLIDRTDEAFEVLETALGERPDDAGLLLFAADVYGRYGKFEMAGEALARCKEAAHELSWLRTAAEVARYRGELAESLESWKQVAARDPQSAEAAGAIADLTALTKGRAAARTGLQQAVDSFPNNVALLRTAVAWLRDDDLDETERLLTRLLDHNPVEPWARRELAIVHVRQHRIDDAIREAELAISLDPSDSWGHSVLAGILRKSSRESEAPRHYRRALELDVDNDSAIFGLLDTCHAHADRAEALAYFYEQLVAQTTLGDGLINYYTLARRVLPADQVLANLQAGLDARPDLWHAWSAVVRQLVDMQQAGRAVEVAQQAAAQFPLLPAGWLDLAAARNAAGDYDGELAALQKSVAINWNWPPAIFRLLDALTRRGEFRAAKDVADRALTRMPLEPVLHGYLADLCWRLGLRGQAILELRRAVEIDPGYTWGWETLQARGVESQQPQVAVRAARDLVARQAGESRGWYWLARVLQAPDQLDERLAAIRKAIELSPDWVDAHLFHSQILSAAGRYDEALAACRPEHFGEHAPLDLRMQEATLLYDQGQGEAAIAALRGVVEENPDYAAGWERLASWYAPLEIYRNDYVQAAEALTRLAPGDPTAWGCLGDARLAQGAKDAAREAYAHALDIGPEYQYAGLMLFDLQADDKNWVPAQATLARLELQHADSWVWARGVRLKVACGDRTGALAYLEKLCGATCSGDWPLAFAMEQFRSQGWQSSAERMLKRFVGTPNENYVLAEYVTGRLRLFQQGTAIRTLNRLPDDTFAWQEAALRLLSAWPLSKRRWRLRRFVYRHASTLRGTIQLWGMVGAAFLRSDQAMRALSWMVDWQTRPGIQPWMLSNVALALYEKQRDHEAPAVSEYALSLGNPNGLEDHHVWLASWHARTGNYDRARAHLEQVEGITLTDFYTYLRIVARATVDTIDEVRGSGNEISVVRVILRFRRKVTGKHSGNFAIWKRIRAESVRRVLRETGHPWAARMLPIRFLEL